MSSATTVKRAVFRLEADAATGGGHLARCASLARALASYGWKSTLAAGETTLRSLPNGLPFAPLLLGGGIDTESEEIAHTLPGGADLLVVDHYGRAAEFETACRVWARRIAVFDDSPIRPHDCDHLIDTAPGRSAVDYLPLVAPSTELLLGPAFAALDSAYADRRPLALERRKRIAPVNRLLLFLGSGAPDNILSLCFDALETLPRPVPHVDLVLGPLAPYLDDVRERLSTKDSGCRLHVGLTPMEMAELTSAADLAVGAAGVSTWERCCLGLPALVLIAAENQRDNAVALTEAEAALVLGIAGEVTAPQLGAAITDLIDNGEKRRKMGRNAATLCDGRGAERIAALIDAASVPGDGKNSCRRASA